MKILVTRPQPQAERTAAKLVAMGHEVLIEPMLRFEALNVRLDAAGDAAALAVTSAKAIEALDQNGLGARLLHLPVYAVGQATAKAAEALGFKTISYAGGDLDSLVEQIAARPPDGAVFYPAAVDRSGDLCAELAVHGVDCHMVEVYQMIAATGFSESTLAQIRAGNVDCALFYSARTIRCFMHLVNLENLSKFLNSMKALCVSKQVATQAQSFGEVFVAQTPCEDSLLALL